MNQKLILALAPLGAILINGGLRVLNILLSPTGRVLDSLIFAIWVTQIAIAILLILGFVFRSTKGDEMSDGWKLTYASAGLFILFGLISIPIGNRIAQPIQKRGYEAFVLENNFIIEAIKSFEESEGAPPETIEQLYPNYLSEPIATLIEDQVGDETRQQMEITAPYDSLDERSAENVLYSYKPPTANDPWQMQVSIYLGSFQSTRFVYNPDEKYSNRYEPISNWGLD